VREKAAGAATPIKTAAPVRSSAGATEEF